MSEEDKIAAETYMKLHDNVAGVIKEKVEDMLRDNTFIFDLMTALMSSAGYHFQFQEQVREIIKQEIRDQKYVVEIHHRGW